MKTTYKIVFPFRGKVKTQLRIGTRKDGSKVLYQPANVKQFENAVRTILMCSFPLEERPLKGYLRFDMHHYTQFKRNKDGIIEPKQISDLDNIFKTLADCFEPIYAKEFLYDENGRPELSKSGKHAYKKVVATPGVIENDKYIMKEHLHWIPVHKEDEERLEVFITMLDEEELFVPPTFSTSVIEVSP
ncbi:hypothetical protein CN918_26365 [Priestia megaterium]|nr:hypothetical protein CN918_26365 [Priestia megaterium]